MCTTACAPVWREVPVDGERNMAEPAKDLNRQPAQDRDTTPDTAGEPVSQPPRLSMRNGYSLFVGTLKVVLPALAVAMILLVVVWPQFAPDDSRFRLGISDLSPDSAGNLTMVNPRFQGRDTEDRPFSVVAKSASQAKSGADRVELDAPKADITLADGAWVALTADNGVFYRDRQQLDLDGHVSLFHDHGFELHTAAALVDLKAGTATSTTPVSGQGPTGHLEAQGFRLEDKGRTIIFTGNSKLTLYGEGGQ